MRPMWLRPPVNADLIVHAVNPPGYRNWRGLALPMLDNTIAAAKSAGARIMFPGTVYNFGPDAFPVAEGNRSAEPEARAKARSGWRWKSACGWVAKAGRRGS
jgi:hypothetical protein